jgi:hypothetical protein
MFHFTCAESFCMNIGDFFDLQCSFSIKNIIRDMIYLAMTALVPLPNMINDLISCIMIAHCLVLFWVVLRLSPSTTGNILRRFLSSALLYYWTFFLSFKWLMNIPIIVSTTI